ncbi:hypothetical protein GGR54DRAFT_541466 [Hypoxylon sp. NC1633]|nr:hypothetical protein GGR54DRAFT_541466 [Hypoxylon sp. NC1633]
MNWSAYHHTMPSRCPCLQSRRSTEHRLSLCFHTSHTRNRNPLLTDRSRDGGWIEYSAPSSLIIVVSPRVPHERGSRGTQRRVRARRRCLPDPSLVPIHVRLVLTELVDSHHAVRRRIPGAAAGTTCAGVGGAGRAGLDLIGRSEGVGEGHICEPYLSCGIRCVGKEQLSTIPRGAPGLIALSCNAEPACINIARYMWESSMKIGNSKVVVYPLLKHCFLEPFKSLPNFRAVCVRLPVIREYDSRTRS